MRIDSDIKVLNMHAYTGTVRARQSNIHIRQYLFFQFFKHDTRLLFVCAIRFTISDSDVRRKMLFSFVRMVEVRYQSALQ